MVSVQSGSDESSINARWAKRQLQVLSYASREGRNTVKTLLAEYYTVEDVSEGTCTAAVCIHVHINTLLLPLRFCSLYFNPEEKSTNLFCTLVGK